MTDHSASASRRPPNRSLSVDEALARVLEGAGALGIESVPIEAADGRVLARPLVARLTQPPGDVSAMDGYAVRKADAATLPVTLRIAGESAAGRPYAGPLPAGEAVRIFTGALVPTNADAVVVQEETTRAGAQVTINAGDVTLGHIRRRGFDFTAGDTQLTAGMRLGPRQLALAAALGYGAIEVTRRPRVAIIATGDELVLPGEIPGDGQITCSNHVAVHALALRAGAEPTFLGIARDSRASLDDAFDRARGADVMVTLGGASVGDHDIIAPVLATRGMTTDFWTIAIRPGKPLLHGRLGAQRILGLPGNPVSAIVCARLFLVPLIEALTGTAPTANVPIAAETLDPIEANGPRAHYMRANTHRLADGRMAVRAARSQDSSLLTPLAAADCLIVRPPHAPAEPAGGTVSILMLDF
jgi:molybdopterin molybdotransferase